MFKIVVFILLFTAAALASVDISELLDSFLKDTVDRQQLADGTLKTTYINIPHREAPGLIEPFILSARPNAAQITVSNIRRLRPVSKEVRSQQVWDGQDYDYNVLATAVTIDVKVNNLAGDLTTLVGNINKGSYILNGNLRDFVMNITMQTEGGYAVLPTREVIPSSSDIRVTGDDQERATVESLAAQIVGDLVVNLFHEEFRTLSSSEASNALEKAVRAYLVDKAV